MKTKNRREGDHLFLRLRPDDGPKDRIRVYGQPTLISVQAISPSGRISFSDQAPRRVAPRRTRCCSCTPSATHRSRNSV